MPGHGLPQPQRRRPGRQAVPPAEPETFSRPPARLCADPFLVLQVGLLPGFQARLVRRLHRGSPGQRVRRAPGHGRSASVPVTRTALRTTGRPWESRSRTRYRSSCVAVSSSSTISFTRAPGAADGGPGQHRAGRARCRGGRSAGSGTRPRSGARPARRLRRAGQSPVRSRSDFFPVGRQPCSLPSRTRNCLVATSWVSGLPPGLTTWPVSVLTTWNRPG